MTDAEITAGASLIVAIVSGGISFRNRSKTDTNSAEIESLKGAVNRDLEKLKAKLSHGQVISSTQWSAEFSSYQAIWKAMVPVRTMAPKIVLREGELADLGLPSEYLGSPARLQIWQNLISNFADAAQNLLSAIHDRAPFYSAAVRKAANDAHLSARELLVKELSAITHAMQGKDVRDGQYLSESWTVLSKIIERAELVESLIRERLADVEIANSPKT